MHLISLFISAKNKTFTFDSVFNFQNINRTFLLTSKHLNMLGCTLFIVSFPLNKLFLLFFQFFVFVPFCCILTRKSINHTYLVEVYTLNNPKAFCFFFYNHQKRNIYHFLISFRLPNINRTSNYLWRYLACCLFATK